MTHASGGRMIGILEVGEGQLRLQVESVLDNNRPDMFVIVKRGDKTPVIGDVIHWSMGRVYFNNGNDSLEQVGEAI